MTKTPRTVNGKLILALSRRDSGDFDRWYLMMREDDEAQETLFEMYCGVLEELAKLRFPPGCDVRNVVKFLTVSRVPVFPALYLPILESEAIVRSALGEQGLVEGIPGKLAVEILMQLITYLYEDLGISEGRLRELIGRIEDRVASIRDRGLS